MATTANASDNVFGDAPRTRWTAFRQRLGMPFDRFNAAIAASIAHAAAAPVDPGPAESPGSVPWTGLGTRNIGGRIRCLAQDPSVPTTVYAGTALGGVFRSRDAGETWEAIGGATAAFPVGAMAVAAGDPRVLYVGSGEYGVNHRITGGVAVAEEFIPAGRGFFRCDTSANPPTMTLEVASQVTAPPNTAGAANLFSRIAVDPTDPDRCWIASSSGLWRREAGPVFIREPLPNPLPGAGRLGIAVSDVLLVRDWNPNRSPTDPNPHRVYAAIAGLGLFRGQFDPADAAAGTQWEPQLTNNLPAAGTNAALSFDQVRLAVCRSFPDHLYAIFENAAAGDQVRTIVHSRDGGSTWSPCAMPPVGNQADWNLVIEAHPDNPAIVVAGAVEMALSTDFGASWQALIESTAFDQGDHAQHADQHAAFFDLADPRRLWVANDGGLVMADDVVGSNPHPRNGWRKRSHGICGGQFNDIAVHPSYPQMFGGGLQDNGTYITYGGETWHYVNGGDGGQIGFEVLDPRSLVAPWQGQGAGVSPLAINRVRPAASTTVGVSGARGLVNADLAPPDDVFITSGVDIETGIVDPPHGSLFIPVVEHDARNPGHFMVGRRNGGAYVSTTAGLAYNAVGYAAALFGAGDVSALAFGSSGALTADRWVGSTAGVLLRGLAPFAAANWTDVTAVVAGRDRLAVPAGDSITRIVVHPADSRYVAVATASTTAPHQGRVFLSLDRGTNWADVTGLAAVGAPPVGDPPLLSLPPSPVTGLAFDPQPAAAAAQTLFAGTLAGVYVLRNLPRRRSPAAVGPVPAFNPRWHTFNGLAQVAGPALPAQVALPQTLANDLKTVTIPPVTGAAAGTPEALRRHRLVAAMYGRGMFVADITRGYPVAIGPGGPAHRLYIRQTLVEDGMTYPRPTPATLNTAPAAGGAQPKLGGDPRLPVGAAARRFTDRQAFDIRVDNAPFQYFEQVLDGVEFDESLRPRDLRPGELNVVYVQVHTRGWRRALVVDVDLYFALAPDPGVPTTNAIANAAPLPDLQADFWSHFPGQVVPAPAGPVAAPRAVWARVDSRATLFRVAPNQPEVARFEWVPPPALAGRFAALLAVVSSTFDPLPANPPTVMADLIRRHRHCALRVQRVGAFVPDFFIRDAVDDDGRLGGVAFGGRSPDLIVVEAAPADPATAFADLGDDRAGDRLRGDGGNNIVYVRVHNRRPVAANADVRLFWALPHAPLDSAAANAGLPFDLTRWQEIAPAAPADATNLAVPARGVGYARFAFNAAPAPTADFPNAIGFIALIRSSDALDPLPSVTGVDTPPEFWRLFTELANANNAALRALRFA